MNHIYNTFAVLLLLYFANFHACMSTIHPASQYVTELCNNGRFYRQLFQSRPEHMDAISSMCSSTPSTTVSGNQKLNSDACFGCFSRAITQAQEETFLNELRSCASTYLEGTVYQTCAEELEDAAVNATEIGNANCAVNTAFCNFEKCVHHFDKLNLVKSCIEEVQGNAVNDSGEADGAETYIKTTACILAKIRCRNYMYNTHPGRPRTAQRPAPWSPYQVNGLFVTADFDLRVIDFQLGGSALVCGFGPDNAGIAAWPGATC